MSVSLPQQDPIDFKESVNPSFYKPFGAHTFSKPFGAHTFDPNPTPSNLKNRCPHEPLILQGIRDTSESLRNIKVVYIVFTWLP